MKNKLLSTFITSCFLLLASYFSFAQGSWTQKADFGGVARAYAVGFSIGSKGYIGTGWATPNNDSKDFWEYNPSTNAWTQMADFGGTARRNATGFSDGTYGYIGTGETSTVAKNDFWRYDPVADSWTARANFGGGVREAATSFYVGGKGYMGMGFNSSTYFSDLWEYNTSTNAWASKASIPGGSTAPRSFAVGFGIGTKGYVGTGWNGSIVKGDFYEFNPSTNTWTAKTNFNASGRQDAVGFSIGTKGYVGTGVIGVPFYQDIWEYDPTGNTWTQKTSLTGEKRKGAVGFSINGKGYIGTGLNSFLAYKKDFWEFDPNGNGINEYENLAEVSVFPNPFSTEAVLEIKDAGFRNKDLQMQMYDVSGNLVLQSQILTPKSLIKRNGLPGGIYFYSISSENKTVARGKFIIE